MTPDDIIKLLDATCICGARKLHDPIQHAFVRDKQITAEMQQLAEENEILLLRCRQSMFRVCGELYKAGLLPVY